MSVLSLNSLYDDVLQQVVLYLDPKSRNNFIETSKRFYSIGSATVSDKIASLMSSYAPELLNRVTYPLPISIRVKLLAQSPDTNTFNRIKVGLNEEGISLLVKNYLGALFFRQSPLCPILKKDLPDEVYQYMSTNKNLFASLNAGEKPLYAIVLSLTKSGTTPKSFKAFDPLFKNDPLIALTAIKYSPIQKRINLFKLIGEDLVSDSLFFSRAVKIQGLGIQFASEQLKDNKSIALLAVTQNPKALRFVGPKMKDDSDVVLASVKKDGTCVKFASEELKNNLQIALAAVEQSSTAYSSLSSDMQNNEQVALTLIEKHCYFTTGISERFQNNKSIALAAVKRYPKNLEILSPNMKNDKEVIEAAEAATKGSR